MLMLWTPNRKTVEPLPICDRCGGMREAWLRANRHRVGSVLLRKCCCGDCQNLASVDITFVGLDTGLCCVYQNPHAYSTSETGINATYNVPYLQFIEVTQQCMFFLNSSITSVGKFQTFYNTSSCAGTPDVESDLDKVSLQVFMSGMQVTRVDYSLINSSNSEGGRYFIYTSPPLVDLDTSMSNEGVCGLGVSGNNSLSTSGSATVSLP